VAQPSIAVSATAVLHAPCTQRGNPSVSDPKCARPGGGGGIGTERRGGGINHYGTGRILQSRSVYAIVIRYVFSSLRRKGTDSVVTAPPCEVVTDAVQ